MFRVTCQSCGKELHIPAQFAGSTAECNYCGKSLQVPKNDPKGDVRSQATGSGYECPRCGRAVERGSAATRTAVGFAGGVIASLLYAAFGSFHCAQCGEIPRSEFPAEVQAQMTRGSAALIVVALLVFALVIGMIILVGSYLRE
jgi:DNA-directed RNA polymerase subunit RPC12/RpoP